MRKIDVPIDNVADFELEDTAADTQMGGEGGKRNRGAQKQREEARKEEEA